MIDYVEQLSTELTFYLFQSASPRGAVRVLAEHSLRLPGGGITLAIIGSSHFLEIETADEALSELLACPRPGLDALPGYAETMEADSWSHQEERKALSYRFDLRRRHYRLREFEEKSSRLATPAPERLSYVFPGSDGSGSALTCLEWRIAGRRAAIATYHTFPDELTIVQTRSVIDFAETGA